MEENLKILEEIKDMFVHLKNYGWINDIKKDIDKDKAIQAIESTINRYKELEEENRIFTLEGSRVRLKMYIDKNYIPVSLVEEKIEEYDKKRIKIEKDDIGVGFTLGKEWSDLKAKIQVLQELLEKRK